MLLIAYVSYYGAFYQYQKVIKADEQPCPLCWCPSVYHASITKHLTMQSRESRLK